MYREKDFINPIKFYKQTTELRVIICCYINN